MRQPLVKRPRAAAWAALAWLAAGCAAKPAPAPRHVDEVPLVLSPDVPGAKDSSGHLREGGKRAEIQLMPPRRAPLVRGTLGGDSFLFLVDSGASRHVITSDVARKVELKSRASGVTFHDAAGRGQGARQTDASQIAIDRWGKLDPGPLFVVAGDENYGQAVSGVAGLLSPQNLDLTHTIVVDLPREELRTVDEDQATDPFVFGPHDLGEVTPCGSLYYVTAQIEGEPVRMLVDTGADITLVYGRSSAGQRLRMRRMQMGEHIHAVSGNVESDQLAAVRLRVGELLQTRDMTVVESHGDRCGGEGILGLDVLRNCALVFGASAQPRPLHVRCK